MEAPWCPVSRRGRYPTAKIFEGVPWRQAVLDQAIAAGGERVEAVQATVHLKRRTKLSL